MSSRWSVKSDSDSQPVTFERLAEAVACGRLAESELVRPDSEDEWRKIEDVPGLDRAVRRLLQVTSRTASVNARLPETANETTGDSLRPEESTNRQSAHGEATASTDSSKRTLPKRRGAFDRPVSAKAVLIGGVVALLAGWYGWSTWRQAERFPKPAHVRDEPATWWFPVLGEVSGLEFSMLCFDVLLLAWLMTWFVRRKRHRNAP